MNSQTFSKFKHFFYIHKCVASMKSANVSLILPPTYLHHIMMEISLSQCLINQYPVYLACLFKFGNVKIVP